MNIALTPCVALRSVQSWADETSVALCFDQPAPLVEITEEWLKNHQNSKDSNLSRQGTISSNSSGDANHPRLFPRMVARKKHERSSSRTGDRAKSSSRTDDGAKSSKRSRSVPHRSHSSQSSSKYNYKSKSFKGSNRNNRNRTSSSKTPGSKTSSGRTCSTRASTTQSVLGGVGDPGDADGTKNEEGAAAAEKVRALPDPLEAAWEHFQDEFQTQANIWQSLKLLRAGISGSAEPQEDEQDCAEDSMYATLEAILDVAESNPMEPIPILEAVLAKPKTELLLSKATMAAAHAVITAKEISLNRQLLMEHLEADVDGECDDADLESLLQACLLQDCKLEYILRQVLRLGLRSALHRHLETIPRRRVSFGAIVEDRFEFEARDEGIVSQRFVSL